ncbi:hypothetical protein HF521_022579 [Silurus meridionalis]|uniref:Uncharacterized protein n=1 Tax=Silurus meridionalis TaxID=175797 RepID=A0A8T0B9N3_SILME|nr:hypothetical protein HF521_022579 [Silurus meridionalis]
MDGTKSKNSKQRAECLEELCSLVGRRNPCAKSAIETLLSIMNHLSLIENGSESKVEARLKRAMKHSVSTTQTSQSTEQVAKVQASAGSSIASAVLRLLTSLDIRRLRALKLIYGLQSNSKVPC